MHFLKLKMPGRIVVFQRFSGHFAYLSVKREILFISGGIKEYLRIPSIYLIPYGISLEARSFFSFQAGGNGGDERSACRLPRSC